MELENQSLEKENRRQEILARLAFLKEKGIPQQGPEHDAGNEVVKEVAALEEELKQIDQPV